MEYGELARHVTHDQRHEEIIIRRRADSMQFNELLILLDPYHKRTSTS